MPRLNVIVLDQTREDPNTYRVVFWADVPTGRQSFYAQTGATSAWTGALPADNTNLANGTVVEQVSHYRFASGTTLAQVEAFLASQWQSYQNAITSNNPWVHYGSTWDGTTWTIVTVT